jgi:hypothetical protein
MPQSDEQDTREAIDEVKQSISRMVDAKLSTARQDVSTRLEAAADEIRDDVAKILGSSHTEVRFDFKFACILNVFYDLCWIAMLTGWRHG